MAAFGSAALSLMDMVDNFDENDADAAIGHGIAAAGFTLFGLGLLGQAAAGSGIVWLASIGAFTPFTLAALGLVLAGVLIANMLDDSPLEEWAANGPFCSEAGSNDFVYLRHDEDLAYESLINCLFCPSIEMRRLNIPAANDDLCVPAHGPNFRRGDLVVTVHLPKFEINQDEIDVRACIKKPKQGGGGRAVVLGPQTLLTPYCVKQLSEDGINITALEYYYRDTSGHQSFTKWLAKARITFSDGTILPKPERRETTGAVIDPKMKIPRKPSQRDGESDEDFKIREDEYQEKLNFIDKDVTGWVYADLSYKAM